MSPHSIITYMTRPCFLVVDREHAGSISTRKLVIETAKLNVITAYSGAEALEMIDRFPNVDGLVVDAGVRDIPCGELLRQIKSKYSHMPAIVIGTPSGRRCEQADHYLDSFDPAKLLSLLKKVIPEAARVMKREGEKASTEP